MSLLFDFSTETQTLQIFQYPLINEDTLNHSRIPTSPKGEPETEHLGIQSALSLTTQTLNPETLNPKPRFRAEGLNPRQLLKPVFLDHLFDGSQRERLPRVVFTQEVGRFKILAGLLLGGPRALRNSDIRRVDINSANSIWGIYTKPLHITYLLGTLGL